MPAAHFKLCNLDLWPYDLRVNACRGPATELCVPSLVFIAQVVFLLKCAQTHKVTDATGHPTHTLAAAGMGNKNITRRRNNINNTNLTAIYLELPGWAGNSIMDFSRGIINFVRIRPSYPVWPNCLDAVTHLLARMRSVTKSAASLAIDREGKRLVAILDTYFTVLQEIGYY